MPSPALFTAIVHTYNRPAFLKQAVAAIRRQTYENLEIILINDAATPETVEYLREIEAQDNRVKLVHFEENQYNPNEPLRINELTRNAALRVANGDYLWVQEDDDIIADDYAERMVALFQENPECTTAAGLLVGMDLNGHPFSTDHRWSHYRPRHMPGHWLALDVARGGTTMFKGSCGEFTIRRDVLLESKGYHRAIPVHTLFGIVPFGITGFDEKAHFFLRYHDGELNKQITARGHVGIEETFAALRELEIERRWQVFGHKAAKDVVSHIENRVYDAAAIWFWINLAQGRFKACYRIVSKIWSRPQFWIKAVRHAPNYHPLKRWSRPMVKQIFRVLPALARISPKMSRLRDRVNR